MRVGVLGRTGMLLRAARAVAEDGHRITFVQTCAPEPHYDASESDFARLADEMGAPLVTGTVGRHLDLWRRSGTDVCISLNWPTLVPERALAVFAHGILNAHAGDLPRYRGNACPNWAILNFEDRVGLTIHRMVAELDAGPWLHKSFLPIDEGTYIGDIYRWLEDAIPSGFQEAIARLETGGFIEQDPQVRPLRTFPRRPEDGRIAWTAETRNILALIRASSRPFAGASTSLEGGEEILIWRARQSIPEFDVRAVPGQVCFARHGNPVVATRDGMVEIEDCTSSLGTAEASKRAILGSLRNRLV